MVGVVALGVQHCGRVASDVVDDLDAVGKGGDGESIEYDDGVIDAIALPVQPVVCFVRHVFQTILDG